MGGQDKGGADSFADVWQLDHSKFSGTQSANEDEDPEEVVTTNGGVEDVTEVYETDEEEESGEAAVDKKGARKQAEEEEEDKEDAPANQSVDSTIEDISNIMVDFAGDGLLMYDETKDYEPGKEGLRELILETIEKKSEEAVSKFIDTLPGKGGELLDILSKGGTVEDFINIESQIDFSKIPLVNKDGEPLEKNQMHLVEDWLRLQGHDQEEIDEMVADYYQSGILGKQAEMAKRKLGAHQEKQNEALIKQREAEKVAYEEKTAKEAESFKEKVLNLKEVAGFALDKVKAKKLYDFITKPVDQEGKTAFQKKDTEETRLLYALMAMDDFNKEKLTKQVTTTAALNLKAKIDSRDKNARPIRSSNEPVRREDNPLKGLQWMGK